MQLYPVLPVKSRLLYYTTVTELYGTIILFIKVKKLFISVNSRNPMYVITVTVRYIKNK